MAKNHIKNRSFVPALIAGLGLILAGRVTAQTFTNLHNFTGGTDGAEPYAGLILSGSTLYGTAQLGGSSGDGTVFKVNTNGTGFTNLYSFTATSGPYPSTNSDGDQPSGALILSGNTLYGTAARGGSSGKGTVFKVNTDGTGFTNLHSFTNPVSATNSDGAEPYAGLILSGDTLYGTTLQGGGLGNNGTVFAVNTNGTGFTTLHSFNYSDGAGPSAELILSRNTLYGTTGGGGSLDNGTVFAVNTDGAGFTNLHSFNGPAWTGPPITNTDGAHPQAGLLLLGIVLYGTASQGGSSGSGTVFAVNTNGTGFTNLHSFTAGTGSFPQIANSDGAYPNAGLLLIGSTLYGTAYSGGSSGLGTMFAVNTDGSGFTNLHTFNYSDGINPTAGLLLSGNTLYGTAYNGGGFLDGTVFSLSLGTTVSAPAPTLTVFRSGANVVLTWPTNATGFTLQSTTNLIPPAAWITNSPAPVVVNGQNAVTNPTSGTKKFYRLSQ